MVDKKDLDIIRKLKIKDDFNKKEELFELDEFIIRFKDVSQYNYSVYEDMFKYLIENRLNIVNEK